VASEQLVVDFCWLSTPTVCMTDEASTHLAAPLALLRLERLSPFLEEPQLFLQRKQRAAEERKVTALALEAHARRTSNNAGGGGGGSGGSGGGAGDQTAASRKRKRHHQNGHAQPTTGATLAPSQTQTTAPAASSASVAMSDRDASPSATSTVEGAGHASASSAVPSTSPPYPRVSAATATETSHSDSEESDASSDTDGSSSQLLGRTALVPGCTAPLTFPRPTKFHLASCEHRQRVGHHFYDDEGLAVQQRRAPPTEERLAGGQGGGGAGGGSTGGAATPGVSTGNGNKGGSATPRLGKQRSVDGGSHHMQVDSGARDEPECGCPPMQQVSMAIHINAEMERLIGLTQAELRALAVKEGAKAMDKSETQTQRREETEARQWKDAGRVWRLSACSDEHRVHGTLLCICVLLFRFTRLDSVAEQLRARADGFIDARSDYRYMHVIRNKVRHTRKHTHTHTPAVARLHVRSSADAQRRQALFAYTVCALACLLFVCVQWGAEINCLARVHITYDDSSTLLESVHTFTPMPDPRPPPLI
jgi:uncharacterized membrane protein YgcG